jgi:hypothetical protein
VWNEASEMRTDYGHNDELPRNLAQVTRSARSEQ